MAVTKAVSLKAGIGQAHKNAVEDVYKRQIQSLVLLSV